MREQDPAVRARNFDEVACGYHPDDAMRESERCLFCPDQPCVSGCPVGINIPGFIRKINEKDLRGAYDILTETSLLPAICGRGSHPTRCCILGPSACRSRWRSSSRAWPRPA